MDKLIALTYLLYSYLLFFYQVSHGNSSVLNTAGRNAMITSLMICCGFIVCWSPNQILFFISFVGISVDFASWFYHFTTSFAALTTYSELSCTLSALCFGYSSVTLLIFRSSFPRVDPPSTATNSHLPR